MITYRVKLITDTPDKLIATLKIYRDIWNFCSERWFTEAITFDDRGFLKLPGGGIKPLHDLCYRKARSEFPDARSQIVIKAEQAVASSYKAIRSNKHRITKPAVLKKLSMQLDKRLYRFSDDQSIFLTVVGGVRVKCKLQWYPKVLEAMKRGIHDPKIFYRNGQLWLSIPCKTPEPPVLENAMIGVDLGIRRAFVTSEGVFVGRKRFNCRVRKIQHQRRQLQAKKTKSSKRKLKKQRRRYRNFSKNYTHHLVNLLLDSTIANVIAIEDLTGLKNTNGRKKGNGTKQKSFNRKLGGWAYSEFRRILEYKARIRGKRVITVNPRNTSKLDSRWDILCDQSRRQGCRFYGADGVILDADHNASVNIANKAGQIPISKRTLLDGQACVIEPNVGGDCGTHSCVSQSFSNKPTTLVVGR